MDHIETREAVDSLFLVGPGHSFDPELDSVESSDPFEGLGEGRGEGQGEGEGEIKPDVALPLEGGETGATESKMARVEIPVVVAKARVEIPEVVAKARVEVPVVAKVIDYIDILVLSSCYRSNLFSPARSVTSWTRTRVGCSGTCTTTTGPPWLTWPGCSGPSRSSRRWSAGGSAMAVD